MTRYDIETEDGAIVFKDNDLVWAISDEQHIQDTINASPGWWKENFSDGVGIRDFLNSSGQQQILARGIKIQLESDLYEVNNPDIQFQPGGKLVINPNAS
jgi:hypothetical protein